MIALPFGNMTSQRERVCSACHKTTRTVLRCSKCKTTLYCSKVCFTMSYVANAIHKMRHVWTRHITQECQRKAWSSHKQSCTPLGVNDFMWEAKLERKPGPMYEFGKRLWECSAHRVNALR